MSRRTHGLLAGLLLVAPLVGCTSNADDNGSSSADSRKILVSSTSDACELSADGARAGDVVFQVSNDGSEITEFYLLSDDGEQVIGEVENIGPGTSRSMTVDVTAGTYTASCKPGMTGDGIQSKFAVTGKGGTPQKPADRTITFDAKDFNYPDLDLDGVKAGETIRFEMANSGKQDHEFEVLDPNGDAIGEVAAVKPGHSGSATVTFDKAGTYTFQCILKDKATKKPHTKMGMTGTFEVSA